MFTKQQQQNSGNTSLKYPERLCFYKNPPSHKISLEHFEKLAVARLTLLKEIENVLLSGKAEGEIFDQAIEKHCLSLLPLHSNLFRGFDLDLERANDVASHFILRLAYARTYPLVSVCELERTLEKNFRTGLLNMRPFYSSRILQSGFRYRYRTATSEEQVRFIQRLNLGFLKATQDELFELNKELSLTQHSTSLFSTPISESELYYKVPFEEALDLVGKRQVFLRLGEAYIPSHLHFSLVLAKFKQHLHEQLELAFRALPNILSDDDGPEEEDRLCGVITRLTQLYTGKLYDAPTTSKKILLDGEALSVENIPSLVPYFPPCMQHLHQNLMQQNHLKHGGRLQYGLYLKALGLSLEDSLKFWSTAFSKKLPLDQFQKQYGYSFRHMYGREGKRADYSAYSCVKIITTSVPGVLDHHGCVFKHHLEALPNLARQSPGAEGGSWFDEKYRNIIDISKQGHYQVACTKWMEYRYPNPSDATMETITHPNQFFEKAFSTNSKVAGITDGTDTAMEE